MTRGAVPQGAHVCPTCGKPADPSGPHRPFCTERCKLVDLGRWLKGHYVIPGEPAAGCPARVETTSLSPTSDPFETPLNRVGEPRLLALWHAAGRAALDSRKRLLALQGVVWSGPALVLGSFIAGALTLPERSEPFARPLAWTLEPLRAAWLADRDGASLLYVLIQAALLCLVWGYFGGALARLAAVDLTGRGREPGRTALAFARRHLGALLGAPFVFAAAFVLPLGLAWLVARLATIPGAVGGVLTPVAILVAAGLALLAAVAGTLTAACAFLSRSTVALEDSDLFDAVSRPYTYGLAGLPRLLGLRLLFFCGVLLGSGWRALRTLAAVLLALLVLEGALGEERWRRVLAVVGALGRPADAERLGVTGYDVAAAAALVLAGVALALLWLADLASRIACARAATYLAVRRAVDRVPLDTIHTPPRAALPLTPEAAGFTEVARIEAS